MTNNRIHFARKHTCNYTGDEFNRRKVFRDYTPFTREICENKIAELKNLMNTCF